MDIIKFFTTVCLHKTGAAAVIFLLLPRPRLCTLLPRNPLFSPVRVSRLHLNALRSVSSRLDLRPVSPISFRAVPRTPHLSAGSEDWNFFFKITLQALFSSGRALV